MSNEEELKIEVLRMELANAKITLYQKLLNQKDDFFDEKLFDKKWLIENIFGKNKEKLFTL